MNGKVLPLIFLLVIAGNFVFSQQATTDKFNLSVTPASPEASMLFKFTDIPVSKFTGVPSVSIPIKTVGTAGIRIDLSLQYHASGIKPLDVASYVGLGWVLNAGGMISRKVRGLPDDERRGFLTTRQNFSFDQLNAPDDLNYESMNAGCRDAEPDEFYFNVNGYSGKFAFDWSVSNNIIVSSEHPVKLRFFQTFPSSSAITKWELQTPDGYIYTFEARETTSNNNNNPRLEACKVLNYTSSWYVTRIGNVNIPSEYAEFTYEYYEFMDEWMQIETKDFGKEPAECNCPLIYGDASRFFSNQTTSISARPREIRFYPGNIKVDFIAGTLRQDVPQSTVEVHKNKSLDIIRISCDGKLVDEFKMEYEHGSRMLLKKVQKVSNDVFEPPYELFYYSGIMGYRNTKSIDAWGFYNDRPNSTLLPDYAHKTLYGTFMFKGGDRSPNANAAKILSLQKIVYPTGGFTEFHYEGHDYGYVINQPVASRQEYEQVRASKNVVVMGDGSPGQTKSASGSMVVNMSAPATIYFYSTNYSCVGDESGSVFCRVPAALARIEKIEPTGPVDIAVYRHPLSVLNGGHQEAREVFLEPGEYRITVSASRSSINPPGNFDLMDVTVVYNNKGNLIRYKPTGGIRIREMRTYDNITSTSKTIRYDYKEQSTGVSSGVLNGDPKFSDMTESLSICSNGVSVNCSTVTITGSNKIIFGESSGSHISYREVSTIESGNGKVVSSYYTTVEHPDIISTEKPFGQPVSNVHKRGLLKNEAVFNEAGNLIKKDIFEYEFSTRDIGSVKVSNKVICSSSAGGFPVTQCPTNMPIFDRYARWNLPLRFGYSKLKKQIIWERGFQTTIENSYDNNLQLLKKETLYNTAMPSDKDITIYRHLADADSVTGLLPYQLAAILSMKGQHRMSVLLEKEQWKNNTQISKTRFNYKSWPDNQVALEEVQESFKTAPLESKLRIERYDHNGMIVQQRKVNDHPYTYLRDYQSLHVIAQVVNAGNNDIAYTSFEADGTGNWQIAGAAREQGPSLTGEKYYELSHGAISKAHLTAGKKYILSYWSKNGAYTISGGSGTIRQTRTVSGWTHYEHLLTLNATSVTINGSGAIDELRLYPQGAMMSTYCYKPMVGVTSECSPNNKVIYYEYDALNRLTLVRDMEKHIIKKIAYEYRVFGNSSSIR